MKFTYAYKTSDGTRHEAEIDAPSREDVFATLRAQGIRPIKVVAEDGSKANGESVGSRVPRARDASVRRSPPRPPHQAQGTKHKALIPLILIGLVGLALYSPRLRSSLFSALKIAPASSSASLTDSTPRHQIYGDPAILEDIERDGYSSIFPDLGERVLAAFAIPGHAAATPLPAPQGECARALAASLEKDVAFSASDAPEVTALKRIVKGMKEELRWYVGDGVGTPASYLKRLRERQEEERLIYERTRQEIEASTNDALRIERNAALRAMGLRTIPRKRK